MTGLILALHATGSPQVFSGGFREPSTNPFAQAARSPRISDVPADAHSLVIVPRPVKSRYGQPHAPHGLRFVADWDGDLERYRTLASRPDFVAALRPHVSFAYVHGADHPFTAALCELFGVGDVLDAALLSEEALMDTLLRAADMISAAEHDDITPDPRWGRSTGRTAEVEVAESAIAAVANGASGASAAVLARAWLCLTALTPTVHGPAFHVLRERIEGLNGITATAVRELLTRLPVNTAEGLEAMNEWLGAAERVGASAQDLIHGIDQSGLTAAEWADTLAEFAELCGHFSDGNGEPYEDIVRASFPQAWLWERAEWEEGNVEAPSPFQATDGDEDMDWEDWEEERAFHEADARALDAGA